MSFDLETVTAQQHFRDTGIQFPEGWFVVRFKDKPTIGAGSQNETKARALAQALMKATQEMLRLAERRQTAIRRHSVN